MPDIWLNKSMKKRNVRFLIFLVLFFTTIMLMNKIVHTEASPQKGKALKVNSFWVEQDEVQEGTTSGAIVTIKFDITGVDKNAKLNHTIYYSSAKTDVDWAEVKLKSTGAEVEEKIIVRVPNSGYYYFKIISKKGKKSVEKIIDFPVYVSGDRYLAGIEFMRDSGKQPLVEGISGRYVDDKAEINWNGTENGRYLVRLYNGYTMETISEKYTDETSYVTDVPKEIDNVAYFVAHTNQNGNNGDFILYDMPERSSPNSMVRFPENQTVNNNDIDIDVLFAGKCKVDIKLNDGVEVSGSEESRTYTLSVPEGYVVIEISITGENGNIRNYKKELQVDTVSPKIILDKVIDGAVTTENVIDVTGECSEDVTLNMNGQKKEVKKGSFSFRQSLSIGENDIKIQAIDSAGNKSNVRAVITRETEHKRSLKVTVLVGATFGIIFLAYIITFSGWLAKKRKN